MFVLLTATNQTIKAMSLFFEVVISKSVTKQTSDGEVHSLPRGPCCCPTTRTVPLPHTVEAPPLGH